MNRELVADQQPPARSCPMACPSSPPPDAIWTMERILNDPPAAPRKRRAPPKPRPLQTFSDVPPSVLLAWPLDYEEDGEEDGQCESMMLISSSSSTSSTLSWDATSNNNNNGRRTRLAHHHLFGPHSRVVAPTSRKLLFHRHESQPSLLCSSSSSLRFARPLARSQSEHPILLPHTADCDDDEEDDRQGSTRHLLDLDRPSPPDSPRI